jgi:hypothetical protein
MKINKLEKFTVEGINPALELLGPAFDSKEARVMILAIALQESNLEHRRQLVGKPPKPTGPAKSFLQGEQGGGMVAGVRTHPATKKHAAKLYDERGVPASNSAIWNAIENDDVLAAGLGRLLLYSDPAPLPKLGKVEEAWNYYLRTWRPGAYTNGTPAQRAELREKWGKNYAEAVSYVTR